MKTIVETSTGLSKYLLADDVTIHGAFVVLDGHDPDPHLGQRLGQAALRLRRGDEEL